MRLSPPLLMRATAALADRKTTRMDRSGAGGHVGIGVNRIKHVKLPVTDLQRSAAWYRELFDLELVTEYAEDGKVRGVSLYDPDTGIEIDLRQREVCAGRPDLAGFDVFALSAPTEEALAAVVERCDRLGVAHTEVWRFPG